MLGARAGWVAASLRFGAADRELVRPFLRRIPRKITPLLNRSRGLFQILALLDSVRGARLSRAQRLSHLALTGVYRMTFRVGGFPFGRLTAAILLL